jgi:cellulose synthase/poly-beta-1,6-N-acetylglucosamine synthase-like glycosyltransferase
MTDLSIAQAVNSKHRSASVSAGVVRRRLTVVLWIAAFIAFMPSFALASTEQVSTPAAVASPAASPTASPNDPIVFAAGDIACAESTKRDATTCQDKATAALLAGQPASAILALGDEQYECGKLSQFTAVFNSSWGTFKDKIWPVPGNHEYNDGGDGNKVCADQPNDASGYYSYFGDRATPLDPGCVQSCRGYYSYDLGSWHLIALNSNCAEVGGCGEGSAQEAWLRADLAAHPTACTLAYWHHPRFSSGSEHGNNEEMQAFWSALSEFGADVVLTGHEHSYERFVPLDAAGKPDETYGMREFVVGTGGKNLYGFGDIVPGSEVRNSETYGVLRLGLHDGWYDWSFLPADNSVFSDAGTGNCHGAPASIEATATPSPMPSPTATATALVPTAVAAAQPDSSSLLFADDFEDGSTPSRWDTVVGLQIEASNDGHILASSGDDLGAFARTPLSPSSSNVTVQLNFRVGEQQAGDFGLFRLATADGKPVVAVRVNADGNLLAVTGTTGQASTSQTPVTGGVWHKLRVLVQTGAGPGSVTIWYDDIELRGISSSLDPGTGAIGLLELGDPAAINGISVAFDDVSVSVPVASATPVTSPVAGVASVGPDSPTGSTGSMRKTFVTSTAVIVLILSLLLAVQGFFSLCLMLFTWGRTERLHESGSPRVFESPQLSFTAILPARHEQAVIAQTIRRIWSTNYPKELLEIVVVCERGDIETIAEARLAIEQIDSDHVRVITFSDGPINKPHGLNVALRDTSHEVVTIFDAEDDVHHDIFQIINTVMLQRGTGIVQAGVQLMDFRSTWFAVHNVLEYFFWFKSRLHFHARAGMVPLGGNTVFIERRLIERVGGWDEACLTEDADIGIRLSTLGEAITITYDAAHATREETPPTLGQFIKQRTRWNQGFIQILRKGIWRKFPKRSQRLLAAYTLAYPFVQAFVGILWIPAITMMVVLKLNVAVAMLSLLPLYALIFQYFTGLIGLWEFTRAYGLRLRPRDVAIFTIGFLPYQILLSIGAIRAVYREWRGRTNWEKTAHAGAHREPVPSRDAGEPTITVG